MNVTFEQLASEFPHHLSEAMLARYKEVGLAGLQIDPTAEFDAASQIAMVRKVGAKSLVGYLTSLNNGVSIGANVRIGDQSVLAENVDTGSNVEIGGGVYFARESAIAPPTRPNSSSIIRKIRDRSAIGAGVILPGEVQIGEAAIVPSQATIDQIEVVGDETHTITVYGSDLEPLYSLADSFGVNFDRLKREISSATGDPTSHASNLSAIEAAGARVQSAYERHIDLADELNKARIRALADL